MPVTYINTIWNKSVLGAHGPQGAIGTQLPKKAICEIGINEWETGRYTNILISVNHYSELHIPISFTM